jgi:2',3'-cyclic-nucleotide 2'-phosphodiesterase (5'-nucleotidase family)
MIAPAAPVSPGAQPVGPPLTDAAIDAKIAPQGQEALMGRKLGFVLSGFRQSQVDPCGCPSKQLGGFDKEARVISRIQAIGRPTLMADAGGVLREFTAEPDIVRTAGLLKAMKAVGFQVLNVGFPDVLPGVERYRTMIKEAGMPVVSSNLAGADGQLLFDPFRVETVTVGGAPLKVAFVGSTRQRIEGSTKLEGAFMTAGTPNPQAPAPAQVLDPVASLKKVLPEARKAADLVVLLHYGRRDQASQLLSGLGETSATLDLVVAGEWSGLAPLPVTDQVPLIVSTGYQGRQAVHAVVGLNDNRRVFMGGAQTVEITQDIPPMPDVTKLVDEAKKNSTAVIPTPRPGVPAIPSPSAPANP